MIDNLRPYLEYKDSDVPWLGIVPAHWDIRRQWSIAEMRVSNVDKHVVDGELPIRLCNYVDVYKNERITDRILFMRATASPEEIEQFHLQIGDVLITKDSEEWDDIGVPSLVEYSAPDLVCGYHLALLRPHEGIVLSSFLLRALQCQGVVYQLHVSANGVTRYGLSHGAIKNVLIPIPPLAEQAAVVRFLGWANRHIHRYISAKQRLIKLLEENKHAIIHRVVTRGIDPNVRLKSSGIGWLGDIPEHWTITRNGRLFAQRNQTGFAELPILEVSLRTGVRVRNFESSDRKQVMSDLDKYKRAVSGDIAYNMMRMWQGAVGVVPVDGLVSPAYIVARPLAGTDPRYYSNLFRTAAYMREVDAYSRGIVKDRNRLYWEDFKQMPSPCPPANEQSRIAKALEQMTRYLDEAVNREINEIELLREYRTRLMADVVTGKLDVREAAATLPEETGQAEPVEETDVLVEGDKDGSEVDTEAATEEAEA